MQRNKEEGIQGGKEQRKKDRRQGWEVGRRQKECLGSERTVMCKIKINSTKSNKMQFFDKNKFFQEINSIKNFKHYSKYRWI